MGNVVGSNIFNIFGILGAVSIANPLSATGIKNLDLWIMAGFSIALLPLLVPFTMNRGLGCLLDD